MVVQFVWWFSLCGGSVCVVVRFVWWLPTSAHSKYRVPNTGISISPDTQTPDIAVEEVCVSSVLQVEDFLHPEGKVSLFREETPVRTDSSLLTSLYFYWVSNDQSGKVLTPNEIRARKTAFKCVKVGTLHCRINCRQ